MDITFNCDSCGQHIVVDETGAGASVNCPKCGKSLSVPATTASNTNPGSTPAPPVQSAVTPAVALTKSPATDTKLEPIPLSASNETPIVLKQTFIDLLRADYDRALASFDNEVKDLIQTGHELKALELHLHSFSKILEITETLSVYYGIFREQVEVLKKFGSERLKQLGYDLMPTYRDALKLDDEEQRVELANRVQKNYHRLGIKAHHWAIPETITQDVEYMLDTLQILVEPDYVPLSESTQPDEEEDQTDRYIPPSVKLAVWRRDQGKCVQCKSKEKLEYDHIIPVTKGGSNTERNVQLLCEKCNREKAAKIA